MLHSLRNGRERDDQLVHDEAGVHTGSHQGHAVFLGGFVQLCRELGMGAVGVREFFTGGNDAGADVHAREQLIDHLRQRRRSSVHDHIRGLLKNSPGVAGNFHAPRRVGGADHFAEVLADFCRIVVDGPDNFDGFFFPHESQD